MNQTISSTLAPGAVIGGEVSGMLGFGTNRAPPVSSAPSNNASGAVGGQPSVYNASFQDSIFGQWLAMHPTALNFTFGAALNPPVVKPSNSSAPPSNLPPTAGIFHWLGPDPTAYDSSTTSTVTVDNSLTASADGYAGATDPQDWTCALDGYQFFSGQNQITSRKQIVANIDPLYQGIYIPLDQARLIHDSIPGSIAQPAISTLGSLAQTWSIPCNSQFTFGIIVGSNTYTLDTDDLIIHMDDGTCVSAIEAWTSSNLNQYLFGARFMSALYLIFTVPKSGSSTITFASRASQTHKSTNIGAIVGGTIGGAALIVLSIFGFLFLSRYYKSTSKHERTPSSSSNQSEKPKPGGGPGQIDPFTLAAPLHSAPNSPPITASSTTALLHQYQQDRNSVQFSDAEPSPSQVVFARSSQLLSPVLSPTGATFHGSGSRSGSGGGAFSDSGRDDTLPPPSYEEAEGGDSSSSSTSARPLVSDSKQSQLITPSSAVFSPLGTPNRNTNF